MIKTRFLTREDLRGRLAISYRRFSSPRQRHGSSLERQEGLYYEVLEHFCMLQAPGYEDKGLSGFKGHNRTKGQLRNLLDLIRTGRIPPGSVLVIEDIHRLSREGSLTVWPILSEIVEAGMVLVVAVTRTIWCAARLNSSENHTLQAAINGAMEYAANLSHMASSAHARRRRRMADGEAVILNGIVLGWLSREILPDGSKGRYLLNDHVETVRRIFREAGEGRSVRAIVDGLNRDEVTLMSGTRMEWTVPRVGAILRDRHVLGLHTTMRRHSRGKPDILGPEAKVFPAAITVAEWDRARAKMEAKKMLTGRPGTHIPNLFTGKAFCASCGAPLRVDTGGGVRNGVRKKDFICSRYVESKRCQERSRHSLHHFERPILLALVEMARFAPRTTTTETLKVLEEKLGGVRVDIEDRQRSIEVLRPKIGRSAAFAEQFDILVDELDTLQRRRAQLEADRSSAQNETTRSQDTWRLFRGTLGPALAGDVNARDRLRGMLAHLNFRLVPDEAGGLLLTFANATRSIESPEQSAAAGAEIASYDQDAGPKSLRLAA